MFIEDLKKIDNDILHNHIVLKLYNDTNIIMLESIRNILIDKVKAMDRGDLSISNLRTARLLDLVNCRINSLSFDCSKLN